MLMGDGFILWIILFVLISLMCWVMDLVFGLNGAKCGLSQLTWFDTDLYHVLFLCISGPS